MNKKKVLQILFVLCFLVIIGIAARSQEDNYLKSPSPPANQAVEYWQQKFNYPIETWAEGDLNNDGKNDTIIIYRLDKNRCMMCAVVSSPDGYFITEPERTPVSGQQIEFKDIDKTLPVEVIVSGNKNGNVGYAIFRLENQKLINLFGENFHSCC